MRCAALVVFTAMTWLVVNACSAAKVSPETQSAVDEREHVLEGCRAEGRAAQDAAAYEACKKDAGVP